MKRTFIKFFDKIIVLLLGFSGIFSSCDKNIVDPVEYGTPSADFEIKGIVTDKATSQPIPNIRIVVGGETNLNDTLYTDAAGKYVYNIENLPNAHNYHLKIEDIDGQENGGEFITQETDVTFTSADKVENGSGHWYHGKFAKTQNAELEKTTDSPAPMYGVFSTVFKP